MAYNIGQMRRDQMESYSTDVPREAELGKQLNQTEEIAIDFYDPCIVLTQNIDALNCYYLQFEVTQNPTYEQEFDVKLLNTELEEDNTQQLRHYNVAKGESATKFELVFTPNQAYDRVVFQLKRTAMDYQTINPDGSAGRFLQIKILQFYAINNVITNYLSAKYVGLTTLKKIGIQGPPGLLFEIDGEEIRIGRSGIYELHEDDIEINSIGFVIKDSLFTQGGPNDKQGKDFFIMDFKY